MFFLKPADRQLRVEFCKFMKDNNIEPENLFFTDESAFPLWSYMNKGQIKLEYLKKQGKN